MILRSSATPDDTALTNSKAAPDISARMLASEVLPLPGGPQRISEGRRVALQRAAQHGARADRALLAGELVEGARPHPRGQRGG